MIAPNNKWLINALLVGLIPVLDRLLMWAATTADQVHPFAASDLVTLGLVFHLLTLEQAARMLLNTLSTLFITCYGVLYTLVILSERNTELIDVPFVLTISATLCVGSTAFGLIISQITKQRQ
ncbi:hypothetical protein [Duganella sp.]|uniref:hypothetical protein n=1 Tax=Duganella sp. TaxID=1904440 RepID=UPI0031D8B428